MPGDQPLHKTRQFWDQEADRFDDQPDHGLNDLGVLNAWTGLLKEWLPITRAKVLDIGCGTGSLSLVLAGLGHQVTGIDLSPEMVARAEEKAAKAGYRINFQVMEASNPRLPGQQYDAILCRHLLWSLPNPGDVLQRWIQLVRPGGRFLLVEGYWETGGGLHVEEVLDALPASLINITVQYLSDQPEFWGKEVMEERFAITAERVVGE